MQLLSSFIPEQGLVVQIKLVSLSTGMLYFQCTSPYDAVPVISIDFDVDIAIVYEINTITFIVL